MVFEMARQVKDAPHTPFRRRIEKDFDVICCNENCGWSGTAYRCVTPKHEPTYLLCPECREVVEKKYELGQ